MKTKLNKEIRDRKKKIYNSLTEEIQKSMRECYESKTEDHDAYILMILKYTFTPSWQWFSVLL